MRGELRGDSGNLPSVHGLCRFFHQVARNGIASIYLPFAEITGVCDSSQGGAISQKAEKLLPERERDAVCLSSEEEDRVVWRTGREIRHSVHGLRGNTSLTWGHMTEALEEVQGQGKN